MIIKNSDKIYQGRNIKGLTARLSADGMEIFWDSNCTDLHSKPILGTITFDDGVRYRNVFLPWDLLSFGFTEKDLNQFGWAEAVRIR